MVLPRKQLQQDLLQMLSLAVVRYGFSAEFRGQSFYAPKPWGWAAFHLAFIPHAADFDITTDVALRFDAVEDLVNQNKEDLSPKEKKETPTIGCKVGNLSEGRQRRWTIASAADVKTVALDIESVLRANVVPYIERFSDLHQVYAVLVGPKKAARLHSPLLAARCKSTLAMAFILGRHDQIDGLIQQGEASLESKEVDLMEFSKFAAYIKQRVSDGALG
jgi:hypothetical protein